MPRVSVMPVIDATDWGDVMDLTSPKPVIEWLNRRPGTFEATSENRVWRKAWQEFNDGSYHQGHEVDMWDIVTFLVATSAHECRRFKSIFDSENQKNNWRGTFLAELSHFFGTHSALN